MADQINSAMPSHGIWQSFDGDLPWSSAPPLPVHVKATWQELPTSFNQKDWSKLHCARGTGQSCEGESVAKCTRGVHADLACVANKCMCKEDSCYVGGQCVKDGCHVAVAQVSAIQAVGGVTSPMAQAAALRAGKDLEELAVNQWSGTGKDVPMKKGKKFSPQDPGQGMEDVEATVALPTYLNGAPVVVQTGKTQGKAELEQLMSKMYQVSSKLESISDAERDTAVLAGEGEVEAQPPMPGHEWIVQNQRIGLGAGVKGTPQAAMKMFVKSYEGTKVTVCEQGGGMEMIKEVSQLDQAETESLASSGEVLKLPPPAGETPVPPVVPAATAAAGVPTTHAAVPVTAVLAASLAPPLPSRSRCSRKSEWSSFFPCASIAA